MYQFHCIYIVNQILMCLLSACWASYVPMPPSNHSRIILWASSTLCRGSNLRTPLLLAVKKRSLYNNQHRISKVPTKAFVAYNILTTGAYFSKEINSSLIKILWIATVVYLNLGNILCQIGLRGEGEFRVSQHSGWWQPGAKAPSHHKPLW